MLAVALPPARIALRAAADRQPQLPRRREGRRPQLLNRPYVMVLQHHALPPDDVIRPLHLLHELPHPQVTVLQLRRVGLGQLPHLHLLQLQLLQLELAAHPTATPMLSAGIRGAKQPEPEPEPEPELEPEQHEPEQAELAACTHESSSMRLSSLSATRRT